MNLVDGIKDKMEFMVMTRIKDLTGETGLMIEGLSITPRVKDTIVTGTVVKMILGTIISEVSMNTTKVRVVESTSNSPKGEVRVLVVARIKDQSTSMKVSPIITVIASTIKVGSPMIHDLKVHIQMQADMTPK